MTQADLVYLMKCSSLEAVRIMEMARTCKKPTWYDLDDDLFNITLENDAFAYYSGTAPGFQDIPQNISILLANCDIVTVSTQVLLAIVKKFRPNKPTVVIPNALDDYMLKRFDEKPAPRQKLITWRGGSTHQRDLDEFEPQLMELMKELKDWKWLFMGHAPYRLIEAFPENVYTTKQIPYFDWMEEFWHMGSAIHIVPLADTAFNRSKSNLAALEAIYAGATPICPKEWLEVPAPLYVDDFLGCVKSSTTQETIFGNIKRMEWLKRNKILSVVNPERLKIIESLV
ncbi:MAG: hypothetical protein KGL39_42870 [Patescibacteria group bacterium]|nr:hypothetical protein [Patescibacteria group bacterium]